MNSSGRDSLDIERNGSNVSAMMGARMSSVARRGSESGETNQTTKTSEVLAQIVRLLSKALILALGLCGGMVSEACGARNAGLLLAEEGPRSTDTSDGDTAVEEKEDEEEEETSTEGLVAAVDER